MSGISHIVEIIDSKTQKKINDIIKEAEKYKKQTLEDARKKAETVQSSKIQKAELDSKAELSRYEASAKLQSKYKVLEAKEALLKEILQTAEENLRKETKSKNYGSVLNSLAVSGGIALGQDSLEIITPKGHESHVDTAVIARGISDAIGKKVTVKMAKDTIRASGGLIVRNQDRTKWVDNTFEARMERLEKKIRDEIATILFE
ncbi:MAG: V-type ATP synthase subunit E [Candidatus Thorarchaeota archaeon]